ncbi:MAG: hypothetical protein Q7U47_02525 [Paludibacter sp.]|nr:hypothetical protein [Paludibacter sp.]
MKRIILSFFLLLLSLTTMAFTQNLKDSLNSPSINTIKSEVVNSFYYRSYLTSYDLSLGFPSIKMTVFKGFKITKNLVLGLGLRVELIGYNTDYLNSPILFGIKFPTITKDNNLSCFGFTVGGGKVSWSPRNGIQINNKLFNIDLIHGWPLKNESFFIFGFDAELHKYYSLITPEFGFKFGILY